MNNDQEDSQFFSQLSECTNIAEFRERVANAVVRLGFTDFTFTVLGSPPAKSLSTLPEKLRDFYLKDDFAAYDFFAEHASSGNNPILLSTLEHYVTRSPLASERIFRNAAHFKLLASLGYHDCFCIPRTFGRESRKAMLQLFACNMSREDFRQKVEQCAPLLPMVVEATVYFGFTRFPEHFLDTKFSGNLAITPKPLKMLETIAKDGLMLREAAAKLSISLDTANKHVAAAKQALGATTLANAVYLAMVHGLIRPEEDQHGAAD